MLRALNAHQKNVFCILYGAVVYVLIYAMLPLDLILGITFVLSTAMLLTLVVEDVKTNFNGSVFAQEMWFAVTAAALASYVASTYLRLGAPVGVSILVMISIWLMLTDYLSTIRSTIAVLVVVFGAALMIAFTQISSQMYIVAGFTVALAASFFFTESMWKRSEPISEKTI